MRVIFEIPKYAYGKRIFLLAENELIGVLQLHHGFEIPLVKTIRCNWCGNCCKSPWIDGLPLPRKEDKPEECIYLKVDDDGTEFCPLGKARPFVCCIGEPAGDEHGNICTCAYKEVPQDELLDSKHKQS